MAEPEEAASAPLAPSAPPAPPLAEASPAATPPPAVSFLRRRRNVVKGAILVLATSLSLLGTVGQFYFVDKVKDIADARAEEMRGIETRTESLRTAQSAYFNSQVQGNLLFALNPADKSVNKGIVANLYQLALLDRAFPFRSILGELAIAGAIEFKPVNDQYNALRSTAMTDLSYEAYMAVGEFERVILDSAMAQHDALQDRYWKAQEERDKADAEAERRRAFMLAVTGAATCLFLLANLVSVKEDVHVNDAE